MAELFWNSGHEELKPPCTERYARWCERTAANHSLLLDLSYVILSYKKNISDQYQLYMAAIQSFEDQAQEAYNLMIQAFNAWRQNQEAAFNNWYLTNTGNWTQDFQDWFDGIRDQLDTDVAGHLQNEIEAIQNVIYSGKVPANLVTKDGDRLVTKSGDQLLVFWTLKTSETCNCPAYNN